MQGCHSILKIIDLIQGADMQEMISVLLNEEALRTNNPQTTQDSPLLLFTVTSDMGERLEKQ